MRMENDMAMELRMGFEQMREELGEVETHVTKIDEELIGVGRNVGRIDVELVSVRKKLHDLSNHAGKLEGMLGMILDALEPPPPEEG
jgi:septal ring factor EnvC (AmiA/AmiB activator)